MRKPAVWVIEDERAISSALEILLVHAGYEIAVFARGAAFLDHLASSAPDLILLDLNLPDRDGLDLCREVRRRPAYIPIIMLTARNEPIDKLIGLEVGADLYLTRYCDR